MKKVIENRSVDLIYHGQSYEDPGQSRDTLMWSVIYRYALASHLPISGLKNLHPVKVTIYSKIYVIPI